MARLVAQWDPRLWVLSAGDASTPANLPRGFRRSAACDPCPGRTQRHANIALGNSASSRDRQRPVSLRPDRSPGASCLELDSDAGVISQESYHPYGGTAWFAGRSEVEAGYKTVRYSGKERDATGLYYYGFRYYVPWLQRWGSPDPAGEIDSLNLYGFVQSNPIRVFWISVNLTGVKCFGVSQAA